MRKKLVELEKTNQFSPILLDYLNGKSALKEFYNLPPQIDTFQKGIDAKSSFPEHHRNVLVEALKQQYKYLKVDEAVASNVERLNGKNTFTVTTGHQLNIFTGPLYFIYKIVSVIRICQQLKEQYPEYNFVPVYWMASEDHDLEEINHFSLFGTQYSWDTNQTGAVGRMRTDGLQELCKKLPEKVELFEKAYSECDTLAEATLKYVNELFGKYGVVAIEPDRRELKALFSTIVKDDILNHRANDMVESQSTKLAKLDYRTQIYPRSINFFLLSEGKRERIISENGHFTTKESDAQWSSEEILKLVHEEPERFSPNVVLRPLYQEVILPNLAYVGGPAEVAYWFQLKPVFDHYQVPFPVVLPRNFALILNKGNAKKFIKTDLSNEELFLDQKTIKDNFLKENAENEFSLKKEKEALEKVFGEIKKKAHDIDQTLEGFIGAEENKSIKSLDNIEGRLKKAEERKQETALKQIEVLKEKLFPNGSPQERTENFLNFYLNNPDFIDQLIESFDPFDFRMNVLIEE
ncbi:MAG: bacillithiol biosynthesis cysteine-adding enzyme BshC [Bacteroidota bacterium]